MALKVVIGLVLGGDVRALCLTADGLLPTDTDRHPLT